MNLLIGDLRMIQMEHYETIRKLSRIYQKSIREISRETGHHRDTIRKALSGQEPSYQRKQPRVSTVMDSYESIIESWLVEDQNSPKKQRHTATRIYDRLVEEYHFCGSASRVRQWVSKKKKELGLVHYEAMIPLVPTLGREAEVDWGEVEVILQGIRTKIKLFVMRSRYSGKLFARTYLNEKQVLFFDAHLHAFSYFGGIYPCLVYDNLTTAVQKVLKGSSRKEQSSFISFRSYYNFESRFCNPGKGHEKGGVEGAVGYVRRNFLVPVPTVESLERLNDQLQQSCQKHSLKMLRQKGKIGRIEDLFSAEKSRLIALPNVPYENRQITVSRVKLYQTIQLERNFYSVPPEYCRCEVNVHLTCNEVLIFYNQQKIARHERSYSQEDWVLDPIHYLRTLERKPGAFEDALPIQQWKVSWPSIYGIFLEQLCQRKGKSKGTREFIRIVRLLENHEESKVIAAMELSYENHTFEEESVKQLLHKNWAELVELNPLEDTDVPSGMDLQFEDPDLSQYNHLLQ